GSVSLASSGATSGSISVAGVDSKGVTPTLSFGLAPGTKAPGACTQGNNVFTGLASHGVYTPLVCVSTPYGKAERSRSAVQIGGLVPKLVGQTYRVQSQASHVSGVWAFGLVDTDPAEPSIEGSDTWVEYNSGGEAALNPANSSTTQLQVRQCT